MKFQPKKKHEEENPEPYTGLFVSAASATLAGIVGLSLGYAGGTMKDHTEEREAIDTKLSDINTRLMSYTDLESARAEVSAALAEKERMRTDLLRIRAMIHGEQQQIKEITKLIVDIMKKTNSLTTKFQRIKASEKNEQQKINAAEELLEKHVQTVNSIIEENMKEGLITEDK